MKFKRKTFLQLVLFVLIAVVSFLVANPKTTGIDFLDNKMSKLRIVMGLDLQGGVHLVYEADMSEIDKGKEMEALSGIQDVIERRVNAFGVSEPNIQPSKVGDSYRLIVELAGMKNVDEAKQMIKETPLLEFKEEGEEKTEDDLTQEQKEMIVSQEESVKKINEDQKKKAQEVLDRAKGGEDFDTLAREFSEEDGADESAGDLNFFGKGSMVPPFEEAAFNDDFRVGQVYSDLVETDFGFHILKKTDEKEENGEKQVRVSHILFRANNSETVKAQLTNYFLQADFESTGLGGKDLKRAQVMFNQQTGLPEVSLQFNDDGKDLFKEITERNKGKKVAIFLDGEIISAPVVNDVIRNGEAVISGGFNINEAKDLSKRLNAGALPVPISLVSQQTVEASLGQASLNKSLVAGAWGLLIVAFFMIFYYRFAGFLAVIALSVYTALMISVFKLSSLSDSFTMTLTLSGIAGFILSVGMAVDANILIFERMKEELGRGRTLLASMEEGYKRAWTSIRDGNLSTLITCFILVTFGTGFIKGFAITLVIGVLLSMFTAVFLTRVLMKVTICSFFEKYKAVYLRSGKKESVKK